MKIALAHEMLVKLGGAERVLKALTDLYPKAPIYTLFYDKKKTDPRALKYLALWETMGGKLFVPEGIRKEMKRVM